MSPRGGHTAVAAYGISRRSGGTWIKIHFNFALPANSLTVLVRAARLQIHEAYAVTVSGVQFTLYQLPSKQPIELGQMRRQDLSEVVGAIQDIYIRAEAWGALADAAFDVSSIIDKPSLYLDQNPF